MIASWAKNYEDIPFKEFGMDRGGLNCWGLLRLVSKEVFGVELPSYAGCYASTTDQKELSRLIRGELGPWRKIPKGEERPGDGILIRMKGEPMHVAVVAGGGWMLHVRQGINVARERYNRFMWRHKIIGFYRHESRMP